MAELIHFKPSEILLSWFRHFTGDIRKLKIYESVRLKIVQNFRSVVDMYKHTQELTY